MTIQTRITNLSGPLSLKMDYRKPLSQPHSINRLSQPHSIAGRQLPSACIRVCFRKPAFKRFFHGRFYNQGYFPQTAPGQWICALRGFCTKDGAWHVVNSLQVPVDNMRYRAGISYDNLWREQEKRTETRRNRSVYYGFLIIVLGFGHRAWKLQAVRPFDGLCLFDGL